MLSKINFIINNVFNSPLLVQKKNYGVKNITNYLFEQGSSVSFEPIHEGTLGLVYKGRIDGDTKIFKTHFPDPECYLNFDKECYIFSKIYQEKVDLKLLTLPSLYHQEQWLMMEQLVYPKEPNSIEDVRRLVSDCHNRTAMYQKSLIPYINYDWSQWLKSSGMALDNLLEYKLISNHLYQKLDYYYRFLCDFSEQFSYTICHGDFSPKNIMKNSAQEAVVIDWEDAFWGVEGYDFLYWLTFFENRKYISTSIFQKTPWPKKVELAILLLIVVLKCQLSRLNNNYQKNTLSFEQRIGEFLTLG